MSKYIIPKIGDKVSFKSRFKKETVYGQIQSIFIKQNDLWVEILCDNDKKTTIKQVERITKIK